MTSPGAPLYRAGMSDPQTSAATGILGPILVLDDLRGGEMHLSALFIGPAATVPDAVQAGGETVAPTLLLSCGERALWRARFRAPADAPSAYVWRGERFDLAGELGADMRLAFVSCNGEETGDLDRDGEERNVMWARLARQHEVTPFALLLHGGDQVYADEATRAIL